MIFSPDLFGFNHLMLDLSMYLRKDDEGVLLLVVRVDDFLYAETSNLVSAFEEFLHEQFYNGSTEEPPFNVMGVRPYVDVSGGIGIDAKKKLDEKEPLVTSGPETNDKDRLATEGEVTAY